MAPINNIGNNIPPVDRTRQQDRVESTRSDKVKRQARSDSSVPAGEVRQDQVDISPAARELAQSQDEVARFQELLENFRETDQTRLADVLNRVESGFYNRDDVLSNVSAQLLRLPVFSESAEAPAVSPEQEVSRPTVEDLSQRIRSGEYDTDGVIEEVATSILRDIGIG